MKATHSLYSYSFGPAFIISPLLTILPLYLPTVINNLSPISPTPGVIIPLSSTFPSRPASQTSVPSGHSLAALSTPSLAPKIANTMIFSTPHSFSV